MMHPEEELRRGLGHLQAAECLYETSLFPELEYTFKHALTHEVAYGSLLHERRRALHARIVAASERLYADRLTEQVERLAQHALRGEVWDKAVAYGRQAGTKALAPSSLVSTPSPSRRPAETSPCRSWRITSWEWPTTCSVTIGGRWGCCRAMWSLCKVICSGSASA